jgi:hypothetical protein
MGPLHHTTFAGRGGHVCQVDKCCARTHAEALQLLLTPEEVQKLINLRASRLPWKEVIKDFPCYSIKALKQIHKFERARGVLPDLQMKRKSPASDLQWFPPCEKRQRQLSTECPAVVIGEVDPVTGCIILD